MRLELVVVRPRLVGRSECERAGGHLDLGGAAWCAVRRRPVRHRVLGVGTALQRLEHRLLRLQLVLEHEPEDEPASDEHVGRLEVDTLERVERAFAHVVHIGAHGVRIQGGKLRAVRPLAPEGVVDVVVHVGDRPRAADGAQDPELLEACDVRVAPDERRHAGRERRGQHLVGDVCEDVVGRGAPALERAPDLEACIHARTVAEHPAVGPSTRKGRWSVAVPLAQRRETERSREE